MPKYPRISDSTVSFVEPFCWRDVLIVLALIALVVVVVIGSSRFVAAPVERSVIVEARWWASTVTVSYAAPSITFAPDADGNLVQEVGIETYERCSSSTSGEQMPVEYPNIGCALMPGDRVSTAYECYIAFHEQEQEVSEVLWFECLLWPVLEPGVEADVWVSVLGRIVRAERPERGE